MAVAISHSYSGGTAGASSLTISNVVTDASTDVVIVAIGANYGADNYVTGVTHHGNAMTLISQMPGSFGFDFGNASLWKITNVDVGTFDVVASFASSTRITMVGVYVLTGVNSSSVNGTAVGNSSAPGTATSISNTVTTTVNGSIVIDALAKNLTGSASVTGDNTLLATSNGNGSSYALKATAGAVVMSWSTANEIIGAVAVEIKASIPSPTPSVSDQLNITESVSMLEFLFVNVNDTLNITESVSRLELSFVNVNDTLNISESVSIQLGSLYFDSASSSVYEASLSTYNWTHTVGTGSNGLLVVGVAIFATGTVTSITAGSKTLTFLRADSNGIYRSEIWYTAAPDTGANTVTVNLSASVTSIAGAVSFFGAAQINQFEGTSGANGIGGSNTVNCTTGTDADWIIDVTSTITTSIAPGSGQTAQVNTSGALGSLGISTRTWVAPPATKAMNWTGTGGLDPWANSVTAIIEASEEPAFSVSDQLNVMESVSLIKLSFINVNDTVQTTESFSGTIVFSLPPVSDQLNITESVSFLEFSFLNVSDQLNITESTTIQNSQLGGISINDNIQTTESVTTSGLLFLSVNDTVQTTESIILLSLSFFSVNDTVQTTESVSISNSSLGNISVSDSLTITENEVDLEFDFVQPNIDIITISESITIAHALNETINVNDSLSLTENVHVDLVSLPNVNDSLTTTESLTLGSFRFSPSSYQPVGDIGWNSGALTGF